MRIIAGQYSRRPLKAPRGRLTRPTTGRTREALFSMLQSRMDLREIRVLDLFAGTGALGLEAISRGAAHVVFVEVQAKVLAYARENAASLEVTDQCTFMVADAVGYLERYKGPTFDLILADPPYDLERMDDMPALARPLLEPHGLFALEHDKWNDFSDHPAIEVVRPYGRTTVSMFRAPDPDDASASIAS